MIENKFFKTSIGIVCLFGGALCIVIMLSSILRGDKIDLDKGGPPNNFWVPTKEDIQYQDSLWNIINKTRSEVDTIKKSMENILYKLDRLYYEDGTWDSVKIPVQDDNYDMDCGDTITVRATMYHPVEAQCDSDPLITVFII